MKGMWTVEWRPVPVRPWRIVQWGGDDLRDSSGRSHQFERVEQAIKYAKAHNITLSFGEGSV